MSCWPECLLLNSATSGCMCSGFDFCLDPNFLTQPTVSCCAHAFPCLLFFASFLIFRLLPPPFHSISSTKAEKASRAQKKNPVSPPSRDFTQVDWVDCVDVDPHGDTWRIFYQVLRNSGQNVEPLLLVGFSTLNLMTIELTAMWGHVVDVFLRFVSYFIKESGEARELYQLVFTGQSLYISTSKHVKFESNQIRILPIYKSNYCWLTLVSDCLSCFKRNPFFGF